MFTQPQTQLIYPSYSSFKSIINMMAGINNVVGHPGEKTHVPTLVPIDMRPRTQSGTVQF